MSTIQQTLFDEATEKQHISIMFPCPVARDLPISDERCEHIKNCDECQRLIKELDEIAYGR